MDPKLFSKIRKIQIKTSKMVTDIFAGDYRSVFKGRGMEFEDVREYQPGDEVRSIDWNVTAKMNRPFVKQFREERELTVLFVVDVSPSMGFGTRAQQKRELVAELCAVLAFAAIKSNDKVGLILFSDRIEKLIPPAKGKQHVLRVIRELLTTGGSVRMEGKGTDFSLALEYLGKVQRKKAVCFLVSDFHGTFPERLGRISAKRHDMILLHIVDRLEKEIPRSALMSFSDLETGREQMVDFGDEKVRRIFREQAEERREAFTKLCRSIGLESITLETGEEYLNPLTRFFRLRVCKNKGRQ
jgi:uncharacterized protein (DUF58 family)